MRDLKGREIDAQSRAVEITSPVQDEAFKFYEAACLGDLEMFMKMLKAGSMPDPAWEVNPLRGVIEKSHMPVIAEEVLHRGNNVHLLDTFLITPRCPTTGNTLLHLAAAHKCEHEKDKKRKGATTQQSETKKTPQCEQHNKETPQQCEDKTEKVAIFLIRALADLDKEKRRRFLDAVNNEGQTALHIAAANLRISLVHELLLEDGLKINQKNREQKTVFDVITEMCDSSNNIMSLGWMKPWKISIKLRAASARRASQLSSYEEEEKVYKETRVGDLLFSSDKAWNYTTNTILIVATLALTLIFTAIFTVPQTLAPQGSENDTKNTTQILAHNNEYTMILNLQKNLGHITSFRVFIVSLTLACLFLVFVIVVVLLTITDEHESRAFVLCISWFCLSIMLLFFLVAYVIVIYI
eukprot:c25316_g2_i1 orf=150-1382(+)